MTVFYLQIWHSLLSVINSENFWIILAAIVVTLVPLLLAVILVCRRQTITRQNKEFIVCPIRGLLKTKKYDTNGQYSEEYRRIQLIKYFLSKGYKRDNIEVEFPIRIGHKGRNTLRVDLIVKNKSNKINIVAEIKKTYSKSSKYSAVHHQLIPAMEILRSTYGIYFDGSSESCILFRRDNKLFTRKFSLSK